MKTTYLLLGSHVPRFQRVEFEDNKVVFELCFFHEGGKSLQERLSTIQGWSGSCEEASPVSWEYVTGVLPMVRRYTTYRRVLITLRRLKGEKVLDEDGLVLMYTNITGAWCAEVGGWRSLAESDAGGVVHETLD